MPINVGEIEAILTARDRMSPELIKAAERVQQLQNIFKQLGDDSPERVKAVTRALAEAEVEFEKVRDKATTAAAAVEKIGPAAGSSAARLEELQRKTQEATRSAQEQDAALKVQAEAATLAAAATERLTTAQAAAAAAGFSRVAGSPLPQGGAYTPSTGPGAMTIGTIADAAAANERLSELSGQAYVTQIERMSSAMMPLTQQQREWMGLLQQSGQLTASNAEKIGVNVIQYKEWTQEMRNSGSAMKLTGDALVASLKGMAEPITREQALMLNQMREMHMLTQQNAEAIGVNAVQYKQFVSAMKEGEAAARANNQSLAQMSGLILRLVENMAVFYVMYKTGEAIVDFSTYVEQLTALHQSTEMSLSKLQEIAYAAEQTGGNFEKAGTYINHMQEALGKMTPATGDSLHQIGLSWAQVFALNPDERFDAIAGAIKKIPDPMSRAAVETQIFGTNAIDPLIMKLQELEAQAPKMEDATVNATHNTIAMYKGLWSEIGPILAAWIERGQKIVEIMSSPVFGGGPQSPGEQAKQDEYVKGAIGGLGFLRYVPGINYLPDAMQGGYNLFKSFTGYGANQGLDLTKAPAPYIGPDVGPNLPGVEQQQGGPLMGQAYINSLLAQSQAMKPLTAEQRTQLDTLQRLNMLTLENAQHLDITTVQFKEYQRQVQESTKELNKLRTEQEKYAESFLNLNSTGDQWRETLKGIDGTVVELGKYYLNAQGMTAMSDMVRVFGKDYGLSESQVRAIGDAWKYDQAQQKEYAKDTQTAMADIVKWTGDASTYQTRATQDSFAARRADADAWFDDELFKLNQLSIDNDTYFQAYDALVAAHAAKVAAANDAEMDAYAKSLAQLTVLWDQYYADVEKESGDALSVQLANIERWADQQRKAIGPNDQLRDDKLFAIDQIVQQRVTNAIRSFDPLWVAWKDGNEDMRQSWADLWDKGLQDADKFVEALTGPFDSMTTMFRRMLAGMLADWEQRLLAPMFNSMKQLLGGLFGIDNIGAGGAGVAGMGGAFVGGAINDVASSIFGNGMEGGTDIPGGFVGPMPPSSGSGGLAGLFGFGGGKMTNATRFGGGAMMAGAGIMSLLTATNKADSTLAGAEAGMGIGTMIAPGIGTAIGAGAGALAGFFKSLIGDHTKEDIARDAGEKFGQLWTDSLIDKIKKNKELLDSEVAGELLSLNDITKEHPITITNVDMYLGKVHDVFSMLETGKFNIEQANAAIGDSFATLAAKSTDTYGFVSDKLKEIVDLNRRFALQNEDIAKWQSDQAAGIMSGFAAIMTEEEIALKGWDDIKAKVDEAQDAIDKFKKDHPGKAIPANLTDALAAAQAPQTVEAARNKDSLSDLGVQAVGNYAAAVATGSSRLDAVIAESDSLTKLEREYKDLGIVVEDEALKQLFMMNDQYTAAKTLIGGIQGLQKEVVNWSNLGIETADMFAAQERTGYSMYVRLQGETAKLGGTTKDALRPMQDYLHAAEEEAKKLGVPLDENTQRMIDQSKELGIWDEKAGDAKDSTKDLAEAIKELVNWLKGIPSNTDTTITTHYRTDGQPSGAPTGDNSGATGGGGNTGGTGDSDYAGGMKPAPPTVPVPYAMGGVVYPSYLAEGGMGKVIAFRPMGSDVIPAMMSPGEGVVSTRGMSRIGAAGLAAINSGASLGGDTFHISFTIHTNAANGQQLMEDVRKPGGLADMIIAEIARGKRGRGTKLKRALEAA